MLPHIISLLDILNVSSPTSMNCSVNPQAHDNEENIKLLKVPAWDDKTKIQATLQSANHDTSLTWSDSLLDGASDQSYSQTQHLTLVAKDNTNMDGHQQRIRRRRRQSKEQLKRKHQIQADLLVEETFINQLKESEEDYIQMRTYYENQLRALQNQLIDMRCQRDYAFGEIEINDRKKKKNSNASTLNTKVHQQQQHQQQKQHVTRHVKQHHTTSPPNKPIARQIKETILHYENQLQRLSSKNQEWERKHTETLHAISTARTHTDQIVKKLHSKINQLQTERNQIEQAMKHDNARLRNQLSMANQEIQQLKKAGDTPKIQQKQNTIHHSTAKKTKNEQYIQHINKVLRKAAAEGMMLSNIFILEKAIPAKPRTTTCLQHSPPPSPTCLS